jgi:hypothetical protein
MAHISFYMAIPEAMHRRPSGIRGRPRPDRFKAKTEALKRKKGTTAD